MIIRIVKMTFRKEETENFLKLFEQVKSRIRNFDGCHSLALLQDTRHHNIMFTYSNWESEMHLNAYRNSELFESTWRDTKSKFAEKAEAWSVLEHPYTKDNNLSASQFNDKT